ncbi:MAG: hypothetical protein ABJP45_14895 [Cyclobacteriaceae bacterium]
MLIPSFENKFDGVVWNTIVSNDGELLIVDIREEEKKLVKYFKLDLTNFELSPLNIGNASWWSKMESYTGDLFVSQYQDKNDPNNKIFYRLAADSREEVSAADILSSELAIVQPSVYEPQSDYFKMVSDFLGLDLGCSCEYLEWSDKIILSYYLRSGKVFDRQLLVLHEGKKVLKELQDVEMKGFASGAFFVLNHKLFFVKNRNEIFVYSV